MDAAHQPMPGPPRARRQRIGGDRGQRVQAMRQAERTRVTTVAGLLLLGRDVILLFRDLAVDPRVPRRGKVVAGLAAVYVVSPVSVVPGVVPLLGQIDDLGVAALALHRLLRSAGYDVIYDLWRGSEEGLALLLTFAGVHE